MATDTGEGFSPHLRGVTVTTVATVSGILAGAISAVVAESATDTVGVAILVGAILVQFPLYYWLDVGDLSTKDRLYVGFMTFALWFVSWGILLTASGI